MSALIRPAIACPSVIVALPATCRWKSTTKRSPRRRARNACPPPPPPPQGGEYVLARVVRQVRGWGVAGQVFAGSLEKCLVPSEPSQPASTRPMVLSRFLVLLSAILGGCLQSHPKTPEHPAKLLHTPPRGGRLDSEILKSAPPRSSAGVTSYTCWRRQTWPRCVSSRRQSNRCLASWPSRPSRFESSRLYSRKRPDLGRSCRSPCATGCWTATATGPKAAWASRRRIVRREACRPACSPVDSYWRDGTTHNRPLKCMSQDPRWTYSREMKLKRRRISEMSQLLKADTFIRVSGQLSQF